MSNKDLAIQYLSQGKRGPFRTRTRVIRTTENTALTRVEGVDLGMEDRLIVLAMNTAVAESRG
jgi:acyl-coenzyme A thioesterase PaaI-like protein